MEATKLKVKVIFVMSTSAESHHRRQISGYVIDARLHSLKGAQGDNGKLGVGWNLNNTLLLLLSGPSQEPSVYKRPMDTSPEEHRGTKAGGNPNCRFRGKNWHLVQSLPGLSQETVIPRYDTHHNERCWSISWAEWGHCLEMWATLWNAGEEHFGIAEGLLWNLWRKTKE